MLTQRELNRAVLARQLLAQSKAQPKQIIIVTDGEPTAHLEGDVPEFNYPPTQRCLAATLREVECATRENIVINTFVLQPSRGPSSFVEQMTSINGGYAFYVWGAYGAAALVVVAEILSVRVRRRAALAEARLDPAVEATR